MFFPKKEGWGIYKGNLKRKKIKKIGRGSVLVIKGSGYNNRKNECISNNGE